MTTTGTLSDERKRELGEYIREMHEHGCTQEEIFYVMEIFMRAYAPIRSYTTWGFE